MAESTLNKIEPGNTIHVKVVKTPTSEGARKTLTKLLSKDPEVKAQNKRLSRARQNKLRHEQRGGRQWAVRVVKQRPVKAIAGESGTITASLDVLTELRSVERFIEVTRA